VNRPLCFQLVCVLLISSSFATGHGGSWSVSEHRNSSYKDTDDTDLEFQDEDNDQFFNGGEWSMGIAATSLVGRGGYWEGSTETVKRTETSTETTTTTTFFNRSRTVTRQEAVRTTTTRNRTTTTQRLIFDGVGFRLVPVTTTTPVQTTVFRNEPVTREVVEQGKLEQTTTREVTRTFEEQRRVNGRSGNFAHYAVGAQLDVSYFFNRYFGLQSDGAVLGSDTGSAFTWLALTGVARYPFEFQTFGVAPYIKAGPYVDIGTVSRVGMKAVAGVELRLTRDVGIFTEGGFRYHDSKEYAAILSSGFRVTWSDGTDESNYGKSYSKR